MYCPICFSEKTKSIFKNTAIDIERDVMFCEGCNLFFVFPLPTADELDSFNPEFTIINASDISNQNYLKMNLSSRDSINNAFKKFSKKFKKLNIFINNAFPEVERKNFLNLKDDDIFKNFESMLAGNVLALKLALKFILKEKNQQSILINISSYSAISGGKNIHLYAASKSALNTLITALSNDYSKKNVKIFSLNPRYIDTPSFRRNNQIKSSHDLILFKKIKKIKKIMSSREFANLIYKKI